MTRADFHLNLADPQPGSWLSRDGIPVDLMVPETLGGQGGRRGARIPPHGRRATRRAAGLEAAIVDNAPMTIGALDPGDRRQTTVAVAAPAALLVAKLYKIGERQHQPRRLVNKDAHDIYRLLVATDPAAIATRLVEPPRTSCAVPPRARRSPICGSCSADRTRSARRWPAPPSSSSAIPPSSARLPPSSPATSSPPSETDECGRPPERRPSLRLAPRGRT